MALHRHHSATRNDDCSAATAGAVLVVTTLGWIRYSASRWKSQLLKFRKDHHGYTTALGNEVDSLLIVCPASGDGLAMRGYDECLNALEQRGLKVEVYVTQSTDDVIHLTTTKHFERYSKMIAVLSGDSSVYEMIQASVDKTNGKWPYAPILVVPGGSSNVLSCEFHGFKTTLDIRSSAESNSGSTRICNSSHFAWRHSTVFAPCCL